MPLPESNVYRRISSGSGGGGLDVASLEAYLTSTAGIPPGSNMDESPLLNAAMLDNASFPAALTSLRFGPTLRWQSILDTLRFVSATDPGIVLDVDGKMSLAHLSRLRYGFGSDHAHLTLAADTFGATITDGNAQIIGRGANVSSLGLHRRPPSSLPTTVPALVSLDTSLTVATGGVGSVLLTFAANPSLVVGAPVGLSLTAQKGGLGAVVHPGTVSSVAQVGAAWNVVVALTGLTDLGRWNPAQKGAVTDMTGVALRRLSAALAGTFAMTGLLTDPRLRGGSRVRLTVTGGAALDLGAPLTLNLGAAWGGMAPGLYSAYVFAREPGTGEAMVRIGPIGRGANVPATPYVGTLTVHPGLIDPAHDEFQSNMGLSLVGPAEANQAAAGVAPNVWDRLSLGGGWAANFEAVAMGPGAYAGGRKSFAGPGNVVLADNEFSWAHGIGRFNGVVAGYFALTDGSRLAGISQITAPPPATWMNDGEGPPAGLAQLERTTANGGPQLYYSGTTDPEGFEEFVGFAKRIPWAEELDAAVAARPLQVPALRTGTTIAAPYGQYGGSQTTFDRERVGIVRTQAGPVSSLKAVATLWTLEAPTGCWLDWQSASLTLLERVGTVSVEPVVFIEGRLESGAWETMLTGAMNFVSIGRGAYATRTPGFGGLAQYQAIRFRVGTASNATGVHSARPSIVCAIFPKDLGIS